MTPVSHVAWLRAVTHSTFDFHRFEALARCHGAADHIEHLERENANLRKQIKDADEDLKHERYYRDAPGAHE